VDPVLLQDGCVDEADLALVRMLQGEARMSNRQLAIGTGLSESQVSRRVKRLFERGIIRGTAAIVDPQAVGLTTEVVVLLVLRAQQDALVDLERYLHGRPEIVEVERLVGAADLMIRLYLSSPNEIDRFEHDVLLPNASLERWTMLVSLRKSRGRPFVPLPSRSRGPPDHAPM
jgi:Lrp/AsnC family leucine-responsive transcriptional regulator